ncbi:MAG: chain length determinant protein tyrosine kinase EpsG [Gammaproteobacteria bacterium]|nr:chain length determinant protein tyrosine kinase EpsG [Gammaproteobacteria bacterium]
MPISGAKNKSTIIEASVSRESAHSTAPGTSLQLVERNIGAILVDAGRLKLDDVERILRLQKEQGLRFGDAALKLKLVSADDVQYALSRQFSYSYLRVGEGGFSNDLIAAYKPFSPQVEMLRALRSQLMLRCFNEDRKALAIVSPGAKEGRSYLAANLAVVFSQLGERTLLIDADLRDPRQHLIFNLARNTGLTSILAGRANHDAIARIPHFSDLSVLAAGPIPPNPLELLGRSEFSRLLDELTQKFDIILIDTPAGVSYSDAEIVAAHAGNALMVTRKDRTPLGPAKAFVSQLTASGAAVIGGVLNKY